MWHCREGVHINLLEIDAICKLATRISLSDVTKGASSKGRSSSSAISACLRRLGSTLVSGDIYMRTPFSPTRLNCADDPTRSVSIRDPIPTMITADWEEADLYKLAEIKKMRRWASNWAMIVVKVWGRRALYWNDRSCYRLPWAWKKTPAPPSYFDKTMGFPGEGPQLLLLLWTFFVFSSSSLGLSLSFGLLFPQWLAFGLARLPIRHPTRSLDFS